MLSYSVIANDPRVRRQVDWLVESGWVVDTLGLSGPAAPEASRHYELSAPKPWLLTKWGTLLVHTFVPRRARFRKLVTDRVPRELVDDIRVGAYDLIVFNEYEFTPWVSDPRDFTLAASCARLHLDIHEYHKPHVRRHTLGARLTGHHYRWVRRQIGNPAFDSRTVVNAQIGQLYVDELAIPQPTPLLNTPPFADLRPSGTIDDRVRLVYHGIAGWERGFHEILDAMRVLPPRFTMAFMLMPNPVITRQLEELIAEHPARDRIEILPPAPVFEIAERINAFDLELIFLPPRTTNLVYALPNKLFEAIQGRLGVVIGESPAMAEIVRDCEIGVVVPTFRASDLAAALTALTPEDIRAMKSAADRAAHRFNAEAEGRVFRDAIGADAESVAR